MISQAVEKYVKPSGWWVSQARESAHGHRPASVHAGGLELRGEFTELRAELRDEIAGLRVDIADGQRRLTLTLVGAMVSISGVTFAANAVF